MHVTFTKDFLSPAYGHCRLGETREVSPDDAAAFIRDGRATAPEKKNTAISNCPIFSDSSGARKGGKK